MATIRKRKLPSGKSVWQCDYKDQRGRRRSKQFALKRDAERFLTKALGEIQNGTYVHAAESPLVKDAIPRWLAQCEARIGIGGPDNLERATYEDYKGKANNHLLHPEYGIGHHKVSLVTTGVIDDFKLAMLDPDVRGRSRANVMKVVGVLRTFLSWAQDHGMVATNPLLGRKASRTVRDERQVTVPSHAVIKELLRHCPKNKELYLRFALLTGLRASEQRALRWQNVDLKAGTIEIKERVDRYQELAPPKSAAGYRTVPIGPKLAQALRKHKLRAGAKDDDLVFPGEDGEFLRHDTEMKNWFEPLRKKIKAPSLRWHDLRHYAISCWIEAGLNPKVIQVRAGHSSIQVTYDRYGHLLEQQPDGKEMVRIEQRLQP